MQRRDFLVSAALVPGLALVPATGALSTGSRAGSVAASSGAVASGAAALHPGIAAAGALGTRSQLVGGFRVAQTYDLFHGAMPFVLEGEGERFQLDVLRRAEGGQLGVHATEHFTFFVHGAGGPAQERGARALGLALERELQDGTALPVLASFEERSSAAGAAQFHVDFVRDGEATAV